MDAQEFQQFYQEQIGPIYRFVYSKIGNREVAEDLTSHIFLKAVSGINQERSLQSMRNSNARITLSSAREGILPSALARLTRGAKPVPYVSVFLYAGLVLALIVIPGIWLKATDIFAYEATIGTVLVVLVYLLMNLALPLYFWKKRRAEFNWFKHLLFPVVSIGVLALPIYGFFAPGQPAPYNFFGWIFLGIVAVSMAWAAFVMIARPKAARTLGSIIADE